MNFSGAAKNIFPLSKKFTQFLFTFIVAIILYLPLYAIAGCSPYIGQASLNEFFKSKSNQSLSSSDFAEVKILNDAIDISIFASWEIKICEKDTGNNNSGDGCSARIPLSDFTDLSKPWLVLQDGTIGNYINTKTGFDAVLLDADGNLIDYLTVDSYSKAIDDVLAVSGSSCDLSNLIFDYDTGSPGTSDKYVSRSPDGTGNWTKTTSAADPGTGNNTNDRPPTGGGTLPVLSVNNVFANKGDDIIFTLTLNKTVAYDVSIQYQAQGGTATAYVDATTNYDYTKPLLGTITFPANTTTLSQTVTITTNAINPANYGSVLFYLYLFNQLNTSLNNNYPSATINPANSLHHIEFIHDGSALTCNPEPITVKACANADCSTLASTSVTVGLLPTGWVGGDNVTLATGSASYQLQHTTAEIITLNTSSTNPSATNPIVCKNISGAVTTCDIIFNNSGFIFDVPTQTSCATSATVSVQAVGTDPATSQCVPLFTGEKNLKAWTTYLNPVDIDMIGSPAVDLTNNLTTPITITLPASSIPSADNIALNFDATATATFTVNYPDAGQLSLNMRFDGTGSEAGLTLLGSDEFVTVPAKLNVSSPDATSSCISGDATCSPYVAAGNNFNLNVSASCDNGTITPNFRLNGITLTSNLIAPTAASAGVNATPGVTSVDLVKADNANHLLNNQTINEVGVFTIAATPPATYLGVPLTTSAGTSPNLGRFYPHHFDTTVSKGCDSFTYSGQPFSVTASAMNNLTTPSITKNYTDTFAFDTTLSNGVVNPIINFVDIPGNDTNIIQAASFNNGTANKLDVIYTFPVKDTLPETITLRANDPDSGSAIGIVEGATEIRSGRTRLENIYGSELTPLTMTLYTEYYSDNSTPADLTDDVFVINTSDSCTTNIAAGITLVNYSGELSDGEISVSDKNAIASGIGSLLLHKPGDLTSGPYVDESNKNTGTVNLLLNNIDSWLTYNWNIDCDNADGDNDITTGTDIGACATASFGLYRGDDRIIYWREVF